MQKALLATLLISALALAGCSGDDGHNASEPVTCSDGTVLTADQIEAAAGHHEAGFDASTLCPVPPQVVLTGLPASIEVYRNAAFTWVVDPGSVPRGHSMLTSIRYATSSVPNASVTLEAYPKEVIKKEHQDLPVTFKGNMTFNTPGTVYVRAYAQVQGEGVARRDVWGPEIILEVLPVQATGVVSTVTHALGPVGDLDPAVLELQLGDAMVFKNSDVVAHTLVGQSGPAGSVACELAAGATSGESDQCLFVVPGEYTFATNDPQPKDLTVKVALPT